MLLYSIGASIDGYVTDRDGGLDWSAPDDGLFACHLDQVSSLDAYLCGRRLYETMLPWETDPALRDGALRSRFADVWSALPKVVFSRSLAGVEGNARLAEAGLAEEVAAATADDAVVSVGGADLAGQAIEAGLLDELRVFRHPIVVGGGTPHLPPVTEAMRLELLESRTFDSGVVYERYRRSV